MDERASRLCTVQSHRGWTLRISAQGIVVSYPGRESIGAGGSGRLDPFKALLVLHSVYLRGQRPLPPSPWRDRTRTFPTVSIPLKYRGNFALLGLILALETFRPASCAIGRLRDTGTATEHDFLNSTGSYLKQSVSRLDADIGRCRWLQRRDWRSAVGLRRANFFALRESTLAARVVSLM
jgi:hypothetical protein